MKIKQIEFKKHDLFNNHKIIFEEENIPFTTFLVGNNGSGKTKVLDFIYKALVEPFGHSGYYEVVTTIVFSEKEKSDFNIPENEIKYLIRKEVGSNHHEVFSSSGQTINLNIQSISKVVFSTIEVTFNEENISSVTSKDIDNVKLPKEISRNLATEIPQLLIDISNLDDADIAKWFAANRKKGHAKPFPSVGARLERFTDSFHKIYGGEKTFSGIRNEKDTKKIIFTDKNNVEISLNELSTGEKQIIYRIGYILKNLANIHGGIILIDEPEVSLHPIWQTKLKDFLFEIFKEYDVQLIIATHSPYIFQNLDENKESCIKLDRELPESKKISMVFPNVAYNPSVQLINYLAYGLYNELLHIELYTLLQIREKRDRITNSPGKQDGIEDWLRDASGGNMPVKRVFLRTGQNNQTQESIMTWIRNKIHHRDELARPDYNSSDLKESIDALINILQK